MVLADGATAAAGAFVALDCSATERTEAHTMMQKVATTMRESLERFKFAGVDVILCSYDFRSFVGHLSAPSATTASATASTEASTASRSHA
jgi:hypothetical protein